MPSPPRDFAPGIHHAWVNATGNWAYYRDDVDRMTWVRRLVRTLERYTWTCIAFCQMTTHVHLVVATVDWSLPEGMRYLNREYSKDFNDRHGRFGQLVRKRYGSRRVVDGDDLLGVYAYVVLNPVREGMCRRPELWRWSSYRTTIGLARDFPFVDATVVLEEVGGSIERLRELVTAEQMRRPRSRQATAGN